MRLVAATVVALAASASAGVARPPVALIASPSHISLAGSGRATVSVTNSASEAVDVDVTRSGLALDLRGRPRVVSRRGSWLGITPRRLTLAPGATGALAVASEVPVGAEPGDHSELVLLTSRTPSGGGLPVRVRLGVVVVVRSPGRVVHRLDPVRLRVRRAGRARVVELLLANRGNVTETVGGSCPLLWLHRGGRIIARLRALERPILPHTSGLVEIRYAGSARGRLAVRIAPASGDCPHIASREVHMTF